MLAINRQLSDQSSPFSKPEEMNLGHPPKKRERKKCAKKKIAKIGHFQLAFIQGWIVQDSIGSFALPSCRAERKNLSEWLISCQELYGTFERARSCSITAQNLAKLGWKVNERSHFGQDRAGAKKKSTQEAQVGHLWCFSSKKTKRWQIRPGDAAFTHTGSCLYVLPNIPTRCKS